MSDRFRRIAFGTLIAGGLAFASAVHAEKSSSAADQSSMMGGMQSSGMMGMGGGMMGGNGQNGTGDENGARNGMSGMMAMMSMMDGCNNTMQSHTQLPNSQFHKPSQQSQKD